MRPVLRAISPDVDQGARQAGDEALVIGKEMTRLSRPYETAVPTNAWKRGSSRSVANTELSRTD